jgi:hypothetical protein
MGKETSCSVLSQNSEKCCHATSALARLISVNIYFPSTTIRIPIASFTAYPVS